MIDVFACGTGPIRAAAPAYEYRPRVKRAERRPARAALVRLLGLLIVEDCLAHAGQMRSFFASGLNGRFLIGLCLSLPFLPPRVHAPASDQSLQPWTYSCMPNQDHAQRVLPGQNALSLR